MELKRGRVSAVYTIAQPQGWTAQDGLVLGALSAQVTQAAGAIPSLACQGYEALVLDRRGVRTAYYIVDGRLWGFGLLRSSDSPCR